MGRSQKKRLDDFMRGQELKRLQEEQARLKVQEQITRDYIATHSKLAHHTKRYPLTEKIITGTSEGLQNSLNMEYPDNTELIINSSDFPEGLVIPGVLFDGNVWVAGL